MCEAKRYKKNPNNRIDKCMRDEIKDWNKAIKLLDPYFEEYDKLKVVASCCGHKKYAKTIVLKQKGNKKIENYVEPIFFEHFSGKIIPRSRNIYKRDKQGYYYIPEVHKPNEVKETIFRRVD